MREPTCPPPAPPRRNPGPVRAELPPRLCAACGFSFKPNTTFTKNCRRHQCVIDRQRVSLQKKRKAQRAAAGEL